MAFDRVDRYKEDGAFKCRKGKECNGRCIPKNHECNENGASNGASGSAAKTNFRKKLAGAGALVGGALALQVGINHAKGGLAKGAVLSSVKNSRARSQDMNAAAKELERQGGSSEDVAAVKAAGKEAREEAKGTLAFGQALKRSKGNTLEIHTRNQKIAKGARNLFGQK